MTHILEERLLTKDKLPHEFTLAQALLVATFTATLIIRTNDNTIQTRLLIIDLYMKTQNTAERQF